MADESQLLSSMQSDADHRERELMNLKMEVAHLRERLRMRVGGDTNAVELEAESFALKKALADTQEAQAQQQRAMQELAQKHAKAMVNLVKLDQAWKSSADEAQRAQQDVSKREAQLVALRDQMKQRARAHGSDLSKVQTLVSFQQDKLRQLEKAAARHSQETASRDEQIAQLTLRTKELEAQVRQVQQQQQGTHHASKTECESLEREIQRLQEENAGLRGETHALRDERSALKMQLGDTKASLSAAMAKFLQLKEEKAAVDVRIAAADEKKAHHEREIAFFKKEVERVQAELAQRDDKLLESERVMHSLERQLAQQRQRMDSAAAARDQEAKRQGLQQEKTWRGRELELEMQAAQAKRECSDLRADLEALRKAQASACSLLQPEGELAGDDLVAVASSAVARHRAIVDSHLQLKKKLARVENELASKTQLAQEYAALKDEHEKTKAAMDRILLRKSRANTSNVLGTARPSFGKENAISKPLSFATAPVDAVGVKRKLAGPTSSTGSSSTAAGFAGTSTQPAAKRVVHVASRYLQLGGNR